MAHIYRDKSKCFCGGIFRSTTEGKKLNPPLPTGAYVQCDKCKRRAIVPDIYLPWKKEYDKVQEEKEG